MKKELMKQIENRLAEYLEISERAVTAIKKLSLELDEMIGKE
jgi:hypothetical protein